MKANELMIGDWVQNTCGHKGKVIGFRYYPTNKDNEIVIAYKPNNTTWSNSTLIQPIPLTEEILKANGFYHPKYDDGTNVKHIIKYDNDGTMRLNIEKDYFYISTQDAYIHIKYVHELQHAIRLCGLNELADNFKIQ